MDWIEQFFFSRSFGSWRYHVKRRLRCNFNSWITGEVSRTLAESNGGNLSLPFGWLIVLVDRNYEHRQGESEETREAREDGTDRSIDRGTTKPLSASGVQTQGKLFLLVEVGLLCRKSQGRPCSSTSWQQRAPHILSDSRFWTIAIDSEFEKEWDWIDGWRKWKIITKICNQFLIILFVNGSIKIFSFMGDLILKSFQNDYTRSFLWFISIKFSSIRKNNLT